MLSYAEALSLLREAVEGIEAAIAAGDWKVDGACDPDSFLYRAKKYLLENPDA